MVSEKSAIFASAIQKGGIAQLARAPALQAGGRRFDSDYLHKRFDHLIGPFFVFHTQVFLTTPLLNIPSRVTEVYILSLATLTLIRLPPFFTCMKVSMSAYHPCLLWPLFRIPSEFIPFKFTERCVYLRQCCTDLPLLIL